MRIWLFHKDAIEAFLKGYRSFSQRETALSLSDHRLDLKACMWFEQRTNCWDILASGRRTRSVSLLTPLKGPGLTWSRSRVLQSCSPGVEFSDFKSYFIYVADPLLGFFLRFGLKKKHHYRASVDKTKRLIESSFFKEPCGYNVNWGRVLASAVAVPAKVFCEFFLVSSHR